MTLKRYVVPSHLSPEEVVDIRIGRKSVFPHELKKILVNYLLVMEERFFGFTRSDVRHFAFELAEKNGIQHPFSITAGTAGRG